MFAQNIKQKQIASQQEQGQITNVRGASVQLFPLLVTRMLLRTDYLHRFLIVATLRKRHARQQSQTQLANRSLAALGAQVKQWDHFVQTL